MQHTALGVDKLTEFYNKVADFAYLDKKPSLEGRMMSMTLRSKGVKVKPATTSAEKSPASNPGAPKPQT
jgi:hypothetical protein